MMMISSYPQVKQEKRREEREMHGVKEKVSNAASAAKEHVEISKAKLEEKAQKAAARTKEEKVIAQERRKAKEAEAKMNLHEAKAEHAAEKLHAKHHHHTPLVGGQGHHHNPVTTTPPPPLGAAVPAPYPPAGHPHPYGHNKYM